MADHEGEIVERKACAAEERAHDGALLIAGVPEQLVEARRAVLAGIEAGFAPFADGVSVVTPWRSASTPELSWKRAISTRTAGGVRASG